MKIYQGLTNLEAQKRLLKYGPNAIEQKKKNVILATIIEQAKSPLVILLVLAAVVSYVLGEHIESIAIFVVVLINLFFTLYQVYKADNAVAALSAMISNRSVVIRGGVHADIDSRDIVVGDIVFLESGTACPQT
jgi:Ca2+-transporting ATPase